MKNLTVFVHGINEDGKIQFYKKFGTFQWKDVKSDELLLYPKFLSKAM